jgi:hypothetical protein
MTRAKQRRRRAAKLARWRRARKRQFSILLYPIGHSPTPEEWADWDHRRHFGDMRIGFSFDRPPTLSDLATGSER